MPNTTAVRTAQVGAAPFFAGKNKIINGDFAINQRSFTSSTSSGTYGFDRFRQSNSGGTATHSAQTFTPGTAPVSGYEAKNYLRMVTASQSAAGDYNGVVQSIEDVRNFAGQTITVSFWAKASTGTPNIGIASVQSFGSGGSSSVITSPAIQAITSSWVRYSFTVSVPSISGKTIGTSSSLDISIWTSVGNTLSGLGYPAVGIQNVTIDIWGVQVEAGSVATSFTTATGTIQGELAACQRYFWRQSTGGPGAAFGQGTYYQSSAFYGFTQFPVEMRATPTLSAASGTDYYTISRNGGVDYVNSLTAQASTPRGSFFFNNSEASGTAGQGGIIESNNASATISWSSEL